MIGNIKLIESAGNSGIALERLAISQITKNKTIPGKYPPAPYESNVTILFIKLTP